MRRQRLVVVGKRDLRGANGGAGNDGGGERLMVSDDECLARCFAFVEAKVRPGRVWPSSMMTVRDEVVVVVPDNGWRLAIKAWNGD